MANKNLNGRLLDLIAELRCEYYSEVSIGGTVYTITTGSEDWEYCYRRIAYLTSCWQGIYITAIMGDVDITVFVDEVES